MTQEIEQVKSNEDAVQERFDKLLPINCRLGNYLGLS